MVNGRVKSSKMQTSSSKFMLSGKFIPSTCKILSPWQRTSLAGLPGFTSLTKIPCKRINTMYWMKNYGTRCFNIQQLNTKLMSSVVLKSQESPRETKN